MTELIERQKQFTFILASQSPRRQEIFRALGLNVEVRFKEVDEGFPEHLCAEAIPGYLAEKKAMAYADTLQPNEILVTADTIVWINDHVLNKPADLTEARSMLKEISGTKHHVYTGVCITSTLSQKCFVEGTEVCFHELTDGEIDFYLRHFLPLDKAGAYGIQEFIGYIGIKSISGDFYNVVGFPVQRFWKELDPFLMNAYH